MFKSFKAEFQLSLEGVSTTAAGQLVDAQIHIFKHSFVILKSALNRLWRGNVPFGVVY